MEGICGLCEEVLEGQPTTETNCNHFFHTRCVFERIWTNMYYHRRAFCPTCDVNLFHTIDDEAEVDENVTEEQNERTRVNELFDRDEKFRTLLKKYKQSYREVSKPRATFSKLLTRKREDMKALVEPLLQQIETIHTQKKQEVLNSQEYRTYREKEQRALRLYYTLHKQYRITGWSFSFLHNRRGFRSLKRLPYYTDARRLVRRKLWIRAYFR